MLTQIQCVISLSCLFIILVVFYFGFECETLVLIASVPGNCLPFTLSSTFTLRKHYIPVPWFIQMRLWIMKTSNDGCAVFKLHCTT